MENGKEFHSEIDIASWKPLVDNIDSRMLPFCIDQATICKCKLLILPYRLLKQLTFVMAGAIASCVSGLSVVMSQVQRC